MSDNLTLVRGAYEAFQKGDVAAVLGSMDPAIRWSEADNFPYADGNPYIGPQAVLNGVFLRLATEWDGFAIAPGQFLDAGERIVATGIYTGVYKRTGKPVRAQFAHFWTVRGGRLVEFQQYTDTKQFSDAMA